MGAAKYLLSVPVGCVLYHRRLSELGVEMPTQLIDASIVGARFDVFVGRARVKHYNEKFWYTHGLSSPYVPHKGNVDWREDAKDNYKVFLRQPAIRAELESLIGKRIGVWGDWGMELGQMLLDVINKLETDD